MPSAGGTLICRASAARNDRRGRRVRAAAFDSGGERQDLDLGPTGCGRERGHLRAPFGQGSRLVHDQRSTRARRSSASASRISTPDMRAAAGAHHDRHRRRQSQRAGQAMISTATALTRPCAKRGGGPRERPDDERQDRHGDDRRHEIARDPIGEPLDRGA
jgi:hypothetical protein